MKLNLHFSIVNFVLFCWPLSWRGAGEYGPLPLLLTLNVILMLVLSGYDYASRAASRGAGENDELNDDEYWQGFDSDGDQPKLPRPAGGGFYLTSIKRDSILSLSSCGWRDATI